MSTLLEDIREILDESVNGSTFWTNYHVYDAANEAQVEAFSSSRGKFISTSLVISSNTDFVAIPSTIMIPQVIYGSNGKYFPTTQAKLEQYSKDWRSEPAGTPKFFVVFDAATLRVWPQANVDSTYTITGVPWPSEELAVGNEDISEVKLLKQAIAHRAAAGLLEFTQPQLADLTLNRAMELEYKYRKQLRNRGGHNIRTLRPGGILSSAYTGVVTIGRKFN